jgi:hypothetical protein
MQQIFTIAHAQGLNHSSTPHQTRHPLMPDIVGKQNMCPIKARVKIVAINESSVERRRIELCQEQSMWDDLDATANVSQKDLCMTRTVNLKISKSQDFKVKTERRWNSVTAKDVQLQSHPTQVNEAPAGCTVQAVTWKSEHGDRIGQKKRLARRFVHE